MNSLALGQFLARDCLVGALSSVALRESPWYCLPGFWEVLAIEHEVGEVGADDDDLGHQLNWNGSVVYCNAFGIHYYLK